MGAAASERRDVFAEFPRRFRPARRLRRGDDWQAYTRRRVHSQAAFCLESPWHHHRSRFRRNATRRRGLAEGRDVELQGQPGWANRPEAIKIHRIRSADLKNAPRFPTILTKVKDFVGDSPI